MLSKKVQTILALTILFALSSVSAQDLDKVQIKAVKAAENIYMLEGQGGNMGLFWGKQGIFIIDDQFAPLHEKIMTKVKELTGALPENANTFVINTHFHGDHTGGNELIGKSGAVIISHENVRKRLSTEQVMKFFNSTNPAMPESGLPIITFATSLTFHLNGDSVNIYHVGPAHTDGDVIIQFTKANVIHTGDIVFTDSYPFIDIDNGGSVSGVINATELLMSLSDASTKIIPGHGDLTDKAGLEKYHNMMATIYNRVKQMKAEQRTLEQIQTSQPTAEFDIDYHGFVSSDKFVEIVFNDLNAKK